MRLFLREGPFFVKKRDIKLTKESLNRREAKKGQGMKSLVRGLGMKSPT